MYFFIVDLNFTIKLVIFIDAKVCIKKELILLRRILIKLKLLTLLYKASPDETAYLL